MSQTKKSQSQNPNLNLGTFLLYTWGRLGLGMGNSDWKPCEEIFGAYWPVPFDISILESL